MDTLAFRLKYAMEKRGMRNTDIVDAARRMGRRLTTSAVSQYMSGKYVPKQDKIDTIARVLNVPATWLIGVAPLGEMDGLRGTPDQLEILLLSHFRQLNGEGKQFLLTVADYAIQQKNFTI